MQHQDIARMAVAAGSIATTVAVAAAEDKPAAGEKPKVDPAAVDKAFETLKAYDWGSDRNALNPIDQAIVASHGDAAARKDLEKRLLAVLTSKASRSAKDFVCRKLRTVGTAQSVPVLAAMLPDKDVSHIARFALARIPDPKADAAMRDALKKLDNKLKVGVIGSLGVRRDEKSVKDLSRLLGDSDKSVARAAAQSLGLIGTSAAAKELAAFTKKAPESMKLAAADACLACAEQLLADGKKADAAALYKSLKGNEQPKHVRLAATRGMLVVAGKKE